jgi:hypothetical protein
MAPTVLVFTGTRSPVRYLNRRSVVIFGTTFEEFMKVEFARRVSSCPALESSMLVENSLAAFGDYDGAGLVVEMFTAESICETFKITGTYTEPSFLASETSMLEDTYFTSAGTSSFVFVHDLK